MQHHAAAAATTPPSAPLTKHIGGVVGHLALQHGGHALQARACKQFDRTGQLCRSAQSRRSARYPLSQPEERRRPGLQPRHSHLHHCAHVQGKQEERHKSSTATKLPAQRTGVHVLGGQVDQLARGLAVELDEHLQWSSKGSRGQVCGCAQGHGQRQEMRVHGSFGA